MIAYRRLEPLIRQHLPTREDEGTALLCRELRAAKDRGYLTRSELQRVCHWKSPRAIRHVRANTARQVRAATGVALRCRNEERRIQALMQLKGVSVPMASAVLTLVSPGRYGVIDIRVWKLLHRHGAVTRNAEGVGLSSNNWQQFLAVIRHFARKLGVRARDVERSLFDAHRSRHKGRLYTVRNPAGR